MLRCLGPPLFSFFPLLPSFLLVQTFLSASAAGLGFHDRRERAVVGGTRLRADLPSPSESSLPSSPGHGGGCDALSAFGLAPHYHGRSVHTDSALPPIAQGALGIVVVER